MNETVSRDEFERLKARVDIVEREVEGEKLVTRHVLEQTRRNGDSLAALISRADRSEQRLDALEARLDGLTQEVRALRRELPAMVADVMRDVLRERDSGS